MLSDDVILQITYVINIMMSYYRWMYMASTIIEHHVTQYKQASFYVCPVISCHIGYFVPTQLTTVNFTFYAKDDDS